MFGKRLKMVRKNKGITQKELGKTLGITKTTISGWETGANYPSMEKLVLLCKTLNTSADYLLGIEEKQSISVDGIPDELIVHIQAIADYLREKNKKDN